MLFILLSRPVRTFEVLTPGGWVQRNLHGVTPGSVFRVRDDGVLTFLAPEMGDDPGEYVAAQGQAEGLHFPVSLPDGRTIDKVVAPDAP